MTQADQNRHHDAAQPSAIVVPGLLGADRKVGGGVGIHRGGSYQPYLVLDTRTLRGLPVPHMVDGTVDRTHRLT